MYGGWSEATVEAAKGTPSLRHNFHKSLAGYMKADGAGQSGPAMFGFTKRRVKPGLLDSLVASFPRVCELWYEKGGGGHGTRLAESHKNVQKCLNLGDLSCWNKTLLAYSFRNV